MIRKVIARGFAAFFLLMAASASYYLFIVHPDDGRISFVDASDPEGREIEATLSPLTQRYERAATLLSTPVPHALDIGDEAFKAAKVRLETTFPEYGVVKSRRFTSPYQVYLPVGNYPVRLEAMDGVFIPAGATLTLAPGLTGPHSVRFFAVSAQGSARLGVRVGEREVLGAMLPALKPPVENAKSFWQRNFGRFLRVDLAQTVSRWEPQRFEAAFASPGEKVSLRCADATGPGCIVSDVTFYRPALAPAKSAIVVLVDTLRADGLASKAATSMQGLAAASTEFTAAIAAGNMTSPSTNAFLSCRRPSDLGGLAFSYTVNTEKREDYYAAQKPSFPARFHQAGFDTAMIGNVSVISEIYGVGVHHGFERQIALERDAYDTPDVTREAIQWLRDNGDHPFLLYLHYNGPHAPYRAPLADLRRTWPGIGALASYPTVLKWLYQSEISYTDRYLGKVFAALDKLGLSASTEIVLTADHGDQHTGRRFAPNAAGPTFEGAYFDHGATLLNDEIHVPLLIHEPGQTEHRSVAPLMTALDVGPTLLESFGIDDGGICSGKSLVSAVRGQGLSPEHVARTFGAEAFQGRAIFFEGRYKFIRLYDGTDKVVFPTGAFWGERRLYYEPRQLYDLASDPDEQQDLAPLDPALLSRAEALYEGFYGVKDAYELVVDDPGESPIEVTMAPGTAAKTDFDDEKIETGPDGVVRVVGDHRKRTVVRLATAPAVLPVVKIDGKAVAVTLTSMRLPLTTDPQDLPREEGGRFTLMEPGAKPEAFLRRVEDNGQDSRHLVTGNPRFEKVLREWGYLSDK